LNFEDFKNKHVREKIIVCGLGESTTLVDPNGTTTIGVNDIGRLFHPTYLLNVNNRSQYKGDRYSFIENTKAKYLFTQSPGENVGVRVPIVKFQIDTHAGGVAVVADRLPHFRNSPYMALALAGYMGARRIGILGVDFTDNHFWTQDGPHRLTRELDAIDKQYGKLAAHLRTLGTEVVNLSPISRLTSLPKMTLEQWQILD
jgi:hypothetical protein